FFLFFLSSRRRHSRSKRDWSSDVCSSDLLYDCNKFPKAARPKISPAMGIGNIFNLFPLFIYFNHSVFYKLVCSPSSDIASNFYAVCFSFRRFKIVSSPLFSYYSATGRFIVFSCIVVHFFSEVKHFVWHSFSVISTINHT